MVLTLASMVVFLLVVNNVNSRNYSVTILDSKLPSSRGYVSAIYDGIDSIYIVGGGTSSTQTDLIKYNIHSETIEVPAPNVVPNKYGSTAWDPVDQSIYYFGGRISSGSDVAGIWKIRLSDPERLVALGNLPSTSSLSSSVWNQGEYFYTIGGYQSPGDIYLNAIVRFSSVTNQTQVITRMLDSVCCTSALWYPGQKKAFVFGGGGTGTVTNGVSVFDETSGVVTKLNVSLPYPTRYTCAVKVGDEAFIVGGDGGPTSEFSFTRFNLVTNEVNRLVIENLPSRIHGVGCAYVQSLNRIYIFGGIIISSSINQIMYIDLNEEGDVSTSPATTTTEETTTTVDPPTSTEAFCPPSGVHDFLYPGNCSLYIRCIQGDPILLSCSPLFWFDKIDRVCKHKDEAVCDEEIPNRCPIDGSYDSFPHDTSCSLYHYCYRGEIYTDACVANAYYDEDLKSCTLAHEAACHSECPETGILFLPIRAVPCQWYKRCSNGTSLNYDCGIDNTYNPILESCVNLDIDHTFDSEKYDYGYCSLIDWSTATEHGCVQNGKIILQVELQPDASVFRRRGLTMAS